MRKYLLAIAAISIIMASCGNKSDKQAAASETENQTVAQTDGSLQRVYPLDSLLLVADQLVDKTVKVRGYVTHTCKHAGKRCFIVGESQKASMRVEAKGDIGGFNRELAGSELEIEGIVKEHKLTNEYIDQTEKDLNEKKLKEDGAAESCQAELANIKEMRDWMKANNKDYYSIYYMDGLNYEVIK